MYLMKWLSIYFNVMQEELLALTGFLSFFIYTIGNTAFQPIFMRAM
jgi:hypothetical protein